MSKRALRFEFTKYTFEPSKRRVLFTYKTVFADATEMQFTETIIFPKIADLKKIPKLLLTKMLESLHIMLGISYFKFYYATELVLPYVLSKKEADFWNVVYKKGLGEFLYRNKLDPNGFPVFSGTKTAKAHSYTLPRKRRSLVGIGGGKDSIVSAELLKEQGFDITAFSVQTNKDSELVKKVIETIGIGKLKIQRILDPKVFDKHLYNGHIPISAIYAFLGVFAGVAYDYSEVIVSNEHSSNFGNTVWRGLTVNHQWSKSLEFESLFREYVREFLTPDITYFSLLRNFYEVRIAELFSRHRKYFKLFSSCNSNFKAHSHGHGLWCLECPKCIFAFTILSPFVAKQDLLRIFGKNLYEDVTLLPVFKNILGLGDMKPFDCVGTFQESRVALYLASKQYGSSFVVKTLLPQLTVTQKDIDQVLRPQQTSLIPDRFTLAVAKKVLILGYGREGKITEQYLKKHYPKLHIGIADASQGKTYLKKQENFDLAIKTPGIPRRLVTVPYTTATNLFFSEVLGKNLVIGVTGSKGKSTTSSLIYEILKTAKKDVQLLGNIGEPMLQALQKPIPKNRIFVLELSSAQLEDLKQSPNISVVTNLFPEHMDYHGSVQAYYAAKKNIINFQTVKDYFVYHPEHKKVGGWVKGYQGKAVKSTSRLPLDKKEIPLLGNHNADNIALAVTVARLLKISDHAVKQAIKKFKGLPHRLEFVGEFRGIKFYDDGSSVNPDSAILGIKTLKHINTIFLGGQDRGFDFSQLEKTLRRYTIKNIILFPDSGRHILKSEKGFNVLHTKSMEKAVAFAFKHTKPGTICLLSGASPSYSLWSGFDQKGQVFKNAVLKFVKKVRT